MANEHIRTAAANLERAAQDMREAKQRAKSDIDTAKRQAADSINRIKTQIAQLERNKVNSHVSAAEKLAIDMQRKNLQLEIAQIEKDTKNYENNVMHQLSGMDGQESELHNLASHLSNIA